MAEPKTKTLYLVDGTSQLFRAYFALPPMSNAEGEPTNAVFGFTNMLRKLLDEERPAFMAVAFDLPGPVFRNQAYGEYKANRPPVPEDLRSQMPLAKRACEVLGIRAVELEDYEADDLIATHTRRARAAGYDVVVVASDKDVLQLVGEGVTVFNPSKEIRLDAAGVEATFGVPPARVLDVQGLMGDSVDNIPGVPGVGEKTAVGLVSTYGGLERVIARADRFVAAFDARDTLLQAIGDVDAKTPLPAETAARLAVAAAALDAALEQLGAVERDDAFRERLDALRRTLAEAEVATLADRAGEEGRGVVKALRPVKKALKELDKGSAKRSWYAIQEHQQQARLSKELATLCGDAPVAESTEAFALSGPDRPRARELFGALGFRSLRAAFEGEAPAPDGAGPDGVAETDERHVTVTSDAELQRLVERCRESDRLAVTTLAEGGDPMQARLVGIALSAAPGSAAYIPLGHAYLGAPPQLDAATVARRLGPLLEDPEQALAGHDIKSSIHLLRRHGMPTQGWTLDTMVAAFLLDTSRVSHGLERLAEEFLARPKPRLDELTGSGAKRVGVETLEVEALAAYATEEAELTRALADVLDDRLRQTGLDELYHGIDGPLLPLLARMEAFGIRIDTGILERMSAQMERDLERLRGEIHELAGVEFNVDSPKQLRDVLFEQLGLKSRRKTAKSRVASTDAQTLEELASQHEIAGKLLEYRELAKLKGTYVDSLPRLVNPSTGRVHTCFHPTGAATGRLSSSDPNLQNIPVRTEAGRRIRSAFVADDGWLFLASDYSQIELRVLAHLCDDAELKAAFNAGEDIHRYTASKVFGVMLGLVTPEMRRRAKAVNFGVLYGMAAGRLAREQGMTLKEAKAFIAAYFERFASVRGYIETVREQALHDAQVRTLFGRVRTFPQLQQKIHRGQQEQALRGAVNATIQGTAADLMKLAMLRVDEELRRAGMEARILLQVHDELLLEVPEAELERTAEIVREAMEQVHPLDVPLKVDQKRGRNWMDVA